VSNNLWARGRDELCLTGTTKEMFPDLIPEDPVLQALFLSVSKLDGAKYDTSKPYRTVLYAY
jgi:hypothetical protein